MVVHLVQIVTVSFDRIVGIFLRINALFVLIELRILIVAFSVIAFFISGSKANVTGERP